MKRKKVKRFQRKRVGKTEGAVDATDDDVVDSNDNEEGDEEEYELVIEDCGESKVLLTPHRRKSYFCCCHGLSHCCSPVCQSLKITRSWWWLQYLILCLLLRHKALHILCEGRLYMRVYLCLTFTFFNLMPDQQQTIFAFLMRKY